MPTMEKVTLLIPQVKLSGTKTRWVTDLSKWVDHNVLPHLIPLQCTAGLMYLSIMGKPTDEELLKYPSVHARMGPFNP